MPPVHNVSLFILSCRAPNDMSSYKTAAEIYGCKAVLKLVPESVCSSGLIKSRSSAYSAGVYLPRKKMIEKFAHAFILCVEIKSGDGNTVAIR